MSFYGELQTDVSALLAEFGQDGTVTRTTVTGGGPSDTSEGSKAAVQTKARMAIFEVSADRIDGTNIHAGDYQVIVEHIGFDIDPDDTITCSEGTLTIRRLGKIAPAGVTVAYDMVCHG